MPCGFRREEQRGGQTAGCECGARRLGQSARRTGGINHPPHDGEAARPQIARQRLPLVPPASEQQGPRASIATLRHQGRELEPRSAPADTDETGGAGVRRYPRRRRTAAGGDGRGSGDGAAAGGEDGLHVGGGRQCRPQCADFGEQPRPADSPKRRTARRFSAARFRRVIKTLMAASGKDVVRTVGAQACAQFRCQAGIVAAPCRLRFSRTVHQCGRPVQRCSSPFGSSRA